MNYSSAVNEAVFLVLLEHIKNHYKMSISNVEIKKMKVFGFI